MRSQIERTEREQIRPKRNAPVLYARASAYRQRLKPAAESRSYTSRQHCERALLSLVLSASRGCRSRSARLVIPARQGVWRRVMAYTCVVTGATGFVGSACPRIGYRSQLLRADMRAIFILPPQTSL